MLSLTACPMPGSAAAPGSVTIHLSEYKLDPTDLTVAAGTYKFFCPIDGYLGLGMQASLVVH